MALVVKDRVKETTATTGTGALTLGGAVAGFQTFTSVLSDADTTYYAIFESSTGEFEVGLGTFTASGTTLARTTILESSNSGSAINLTAGAADVFITQPAEKAVFLDASDNIIAANGSALTNLNASNLASGTVNNARLDQQLQDVAGLTPADGAFVVGDGSNFVAESGATARTSLGLGTAATTAATAYATAAQGVTADAALPKVGGAMTGAITTNSTFDGRDVATDGTKLDGIEAAADVTDATNVTAAGALMDSEVANLAQVKAFDSADYATAAQGVTADAALPKAGGTMTGNVIHNDGVKAIFGTGSDLAIWHNSANTYFQNITGTINIQAKSGESSIVAGPDGAVDLYYDNVRKIGTTTSGIEVSGVVVAESLQEDYDALSGTSPAPDADNAGYFSLSTSGNTTFTFGAVTSGRSVSFVLEVTAGGTHTLTWPGTVDWAGGSAPDAPASGVKNIYVFITRDGGTNWYGFLSGAAMA